MGGCGGGEEPDETRGDAKQAAQVVQSLNRAIAGRDFRLICDELFAAEVRAQAGGDDCPALLRRTTSGLSNPRIELTEIAVKGDRATVEVVTTARGQARAPDKIELVRERGRFRISALGA